MDILKLKRIETRPNTNVPFYDWTQHQDYYRTNYWDTGIQIGDDFELSEDGLTRTRTATYNGVPGIIELLSSDATLSQYQSLHKAYSDLHGITRSTMGFEVYNEQGTLIISGENPTV
jgi:hypothetical protein